MTKTDDRLKEWKKVKGVSIDKEEGGPLRDETPTKEAITDVANEGKKVATSNRWYHSFFSIVDLLGKLKIRKSWLILMELFLPICEFLMARTLNNGVSRWVSSLASKKESDCKALFLIHQCLDSTDFEKIALANSAKEAWDILNKSYGGANKIKKVKLQSFCRQYELLSMNDQESIEDYFTRIQMLVNSMKACGEKLLDQQIVNKILRTLTPPPLPNLTTLW
ncbi:hypothetical protein CR513_15348, partial [Mucuna pruriens]